MTPGLQKFQVMVQSMDNTFSPGDVVNGKIVVELGRTKSIRGLKIQIKGKAEVKWSENSGTGKDKTTDWYKADEEYFRLEYWPLGGSSNAENIDIQAGYHEFPFSFCLPHNIPSSFEHTNCNVRYTIKAVMDRPWKFDHETSALITVQAPYDITQYPSVTGIIEDEKDKTFCCFPCIKVGSMTYHIYVPKNGFAFGDNIQAKIDLNNYSRSVEVTKINLFIEQKIILHAQHPRSKTKTYSKIIQRTKAEGPFDKSTSIMMSLQVLTMPPSNFPKCSIIDIEYRLKVKISVSGCHCSMDSSYPITIGPGPAIGVQPMPNYVPPGLIENPTIRPIQPSGPSAPFIADDIPIRLEPANQVYPPPRLSPTPGFQYPGTVSPPIGFVDPSSTRPLIGFTNSPPPSYDACIKMDEKK